MQLMHGYLHITIATDKRDMKKPSLNCAVTARPDRQPVLYSRQLRSRLALWVTDIFFCMHQVKPQPPQSISCIHFWYLAGANLGNPI